MTESAKFEDRRSRRKTDRRSQRRYPGPSDVDRTPKKLVPRRQYPPGVRIWFCSRAYLENDQRRSLPALQGVTGGHRERIVAMLARRVDQRQTPRNSSRQRVRRRSAAPAEMSTTSSWSKQTFRVAHVSTRSAISHFRQYGQQPPPRFRIRRQSCCTSPCHPDVILKPRRNSRRDGRVAGTSGGGLEQAKR